ncbi:MAG: 23S rRNA (adenine(2030)-N(6))-methyltransferase RlmJ [Hyphomicrobiaceae bacterium]|nr:MAG: 23S rRNA (adenine(2030)-N(6))-methyltransferase RlmJ [Hyphomicrobiaceae bacterium]
MNYRHVYHAGNFADVLKHAVFTLIIEHLKRKDAPFRVIDTHAGRGRYPLTSAAAGKTGEWRDGIGRLLGRDVRTLPHDAAQILAPYLEAVRAENAPGAINMYPGSPCLARRLMRPQDVLIVNEIHPDELEQLRAAVGRDRRVKVMELDGWVALRSLLPPKERRGVILIDPPFEQEGEFGRIAEGLAQGLQRFATGIFVAWYPIKDPKPIARFHEALAAMGERRFLRVELLIRRPSDPDTLNGCGLVIANPSYTLEGDLGVIMPVLSHVLAQGAGSRHRIDWIAGPLQGARNGAREGKRRVRTAG